MSRALPIATVIAALMAAAPLRASAACSQAINPTSADWTVPGTLAGWESTNDYCKWQISFPPGDETNGAPGDDVLGYSYTHSATPYTDLYFLIQLAGPPNANTTYEMVHDGTDNTVSTYKTTCTLACANGCTAACRATCAESCASANCTVTPTCATTLSVVGSSDGKCAGTVNPVDYTTTYNATPGNIKEPDGGTTTGYFIDIGGPNMTPACYPYYETTAYKLTVIGPDGGTVDSASVTDTSPDNFIGSTAVALLSFTARASSSGTDLSWDTGSEHGTVGFVVHRGTPDGPAVNAALIPGQLESPAGKHYALHDPQGQPSSVYYLEELSIERRRTYGPSRWETGLELARWHGLTHLHLADSCQAEETPRLSRRAAPPPQDAFVRVSSEGIFTVSEAQLEPLGLTGSVQLSHDGAAWPLFRLPDGRLAFYAPASDSPERAADAYELTPTTGPLLPPETVVSATSGFDTSFISTVHAEQHTTVDLPAEPDHRFPWNYAFSGTPTTFSFDAPGLLAGAASISVRLIGLDAFSHDAQIQVNGVSVPDTLFAGTGETVASFSLTSGVLIPSGNVLTLNAVAAPDAGYDLVGLISIDATYPRSYEASGDGLTFTASSGTAVDVSGFTGAPLVFDLTVPAQPRLLRGVSTGRAFGSTSTSLEFRAPSSRLAPGARTYYAAIPQAATLAPSLAGDVPSGSADYVAIVGSGLAATVQPLLALRQNQGLTVQSVEVEALYDRFNNGEHGPEAIQAYLAQLSPPPTYVVLVGKPSIDPHDYLETGTPDLVPAPYILTADYADLAIFDGAYAAGPAGLTPIFAIGRLPAQSADELAPLVAKLVAYETGGQGPSGSAIWAADDDDPDTGLPDSFFVSESTLWASQFPQLQPLDVYLPNQTTTDLLADLALGPDLVSYHGHGDGLDWSTSGLLSANDVGSFPAARPFFLITVDCWDGMYAMPTFAPLSQLIVETAQGGALAAYSASSLVEETRDPGIDTAIYTALANPSFMTVGQVTLAAQQALAAQTAPASDLARVYNLLGDPATTLPSR